jgi:hypothetical protein
MSSLGPGRLTASDAFAGDPVEVRSPAASVAGKLGWKPAVVTHPNRAPTIAPSPSTRTGSASCLALEVRPNRQLAINFKKASLTHAEQCVIEPAQPLLNAFEVFGSGPEMF